MRKWQAGSDHEKLRMAREVAKRLGHAFLGTEHLLLRALISEDVQERFARAGIDPADGRLALEASAADAHRSLPTGIGAGGELPITGMARRIVERATRRGEERGRGLDPAAILDTILEGGHSPAGGVLHRLGMPGVRSRSSVPLQMRAELERAGIRW